MGGVGTRSRPNWVFGGEGDSHGSERGVVERRELVEAGMLGTEGESDGGQTRKSRHGRGDINKGHAVDEAEQREARRRGV